MMIIQPKWWQQVWWSSKSLAKVESCRSITSTISSWLFSPLRIIVQTSTMCFLSWLFNLFAILQGKLFLHFLQYLPESTSTVWYFKVSTLLWADLWCLFHRHLSKVLWDKIWSNKKEWAWVSQRDPIKQNGQTKWAD